MGTRRYRSFGLVALGVAGGVLVSLGISAAAQRGEPLPLKELQQFANVFSAIKSSYVEPISDKTLINDAIKGLFSDLDPHSAYLDPDAYKEMESMTQGGFGGLGIEIGSEDGMPKVIAPIEDTPAARAGILAGDLITEIDGKPTKGMTLNDAIKLMRGEPKTSIVLTIKRDGKDKPLTFKIVRDLIKVRSVRSKMLPNDIAFVRISQFQETTVSDLVKQLHTLGEKSTPKGLILDLRNDPGGLLESAIGVSSAFLKPNALVVSTKGRVPSSNHQYLAKSIGTVSELGNWTKKVPMVVLVNVGSASASEIVAGALQDHKRAKIMGNRTFGKGSVQSVLPLSDDTGIKITTARYYTPSGRSIQVTGVEPDITVDDTAQGNLFQLPREVDLKHHLLNSAVTKENTAEEKDVGKPKVEPKMFEFGGTDDFQLRQAVNYLEGRSVHKIEPGLILTSSAKPGTAGAPKEAPAGKSGAAEKKTEIIPEKGSKAPAGKPVQPQSDMPAQPSGQKIERFKITPDGLIKIQ
ncbi:S41 family peptidase [Paralcaligenes sp. KSB-10]|uniref:S41 family peptidase n=1 Tax=Paralcaligenes sp. KSB-10 TaxID=2901142 RepID=UPI001E29BE3E|nr:S41 family peptidase [Paralcaligenes sp. KSB-10]UHL62878.1 S41 family peptidase [Paralcaligenes sp. KSB-10]